MECVRGAVTTSKPEGACARSQTELWLRLGLCLGAVTFSRGRRSQDNIIPTASLLLSTSVLHVSNPIRILKARSLVEAAHSSQLPGHRIAWRRVVCGTGGVNRFCQPLLLKGRQDGDEEGWLSLSTQASLRTKSKSL